MRFYRCVPCKASCTVYSILALLLSLLFRATTAITLDLEDKASIKRAAGTAAHGLLSFYHGNETGQIPGLLPSPYYWWEAGAMFMSLIDYWAYTGDSQYNNLITQGMLHQAGPKNDYMTPNQTLTTGNDDQGFWGMAALGAAELGFPDPESDQPQWLALAQAVFETQAARWDTTTCGGGLRWQVFPFNAGFNYKNTISIGCFFNLAARLARHTGNSTYADWANKAWDWTSNVGLISPKYEFFDGTDVLLKCAELNRLEWSYNAGVFLHGAANMYSLDNSTVWANRTTATLTSLLSHFFHPNSSTMYERACEELNTCNHDQRSFKAYLSRFMAFTAPLAPWTAPAISTALAASSTAAAAQCSGGTDGTFCGLHWTHGAVWDGWQGPGEQMAAMAVIGANLVDGVGVAGLAEGSEEARNRGPASVTPGIVDGYNSTSGEYVGREFGKGDRAGAGFLTGLLALFTVGGGVWVCM